MVRIKSERAIGPARVIALLVIAVLAMGLGYLRFGAQEPSVSVPAGAEAGDLTPFEPCGQSQPDAECATIVVQENRADANSRLIALPVTRFSAAAEESSEPIFYFQGGPGVPNQNPDAPDFADRFTGSRDVVFVGYRGVEGSSVLACPEVAAALRASTDLIGERSLERTTDAFESCADRLVSEGVDLDGYTLTQRVEDMEAVRVALGYDQIDLLSESAGTRTAMIYSWRYPESIHRSVMIGVNPPGNYLWYPETTDAQIRDYADLCAQDEDCSSRTDDLVATMREISDDMPDRWLSLSINESNVKVGSFYGLMETTSAASPLTGPMVLDSWLSAAEGDPSGLWLLNAAFNVVYPDKAWGESAATGSIDVEYGSDYYGSGGDPGSILSNSASDFTWLGGRLAGLWPAGPDDARYSEVMETDVETLLIGGRLDFSAPPMNATEQLLPYLSNGHQVVLEDFGHTVDFWTSQPEAADRLINHYLDTGEVDDTGYVHQAVDFAPETTHVSLAKLLVGTMAGMAALFLLMLIWMPIHVRGRGRFGPSTAVLMRALLVPLVMGLGGWFFVWLGLMTFWPSLPVGNQWVTVLAIGLPVATGTYWAWVHRDWPDMVRRTGWWLALIGGVAGAWAGFHASTGLLAPVTTILGAAITVNLVLIIRSISWDLAGRPDHRENAGSDFEPGGRIDSPIPELTRP